jgi:hypothetical protein
MPSERKYPCTARCFDYHKGYGFIEVTVLGPAEVLSCCGSDPVHRIELPDGYPEPPGKCDTWVAGPGFLKF